MDRNRNIIGYLSIHPIIADDAAGVVGRRQGWRKLVGREGGVEGWSEGVGNGCSDRIS